METTCTLPRQAKTDDIKSVQAGQTVDVNVHETLQDSGRMHAVDRAKVGRRVYPHLSF